MNLGYTGIAYCGNPECAEEFSPTERGEEFCSDECEEQAFEYREREEFLEIYRYCL